MSYNEKVLSCTEKKPIRTLFRIKEDKNHIIAIKFCLIQTKYTIVFFTSTLTKHFSQQMLKNYTCEG